MTVPTPSASSDAARAVGSVHRFAVAQPTLAEVFRDVVTP